MYTIIYKLLKIFKNIIFESIYLKNRIFLRISGVTLGKNVKSLSVFSIESPHKLNIGNNVWIGENCSFYASSGIKIGNNVMIARLVSIISNDHNWSEINKNIIEQGKKIGKIPIEIEDNVLIGEKAIILKKVRIETGSVIGAGSVVTKNVPPYTIVAGNPAKIIKRRK